MKKYNYLLSFLMGSAIIIKKLEELKRSVENYINNNPDNIQSALKHIEEQVDDALSKA